MTEEFAHPLNRRLRDIAVAYPETVEGASCVNRAFKAGGKKNFLFLGEKDGRSRLMLKLDGSVDEAKAFAESGPGDVSVGDNGWVTALFATDDNPNIDMLARWIDESFRLLAPKKTRAQLHD